MFIESALAYLKNGICTIPTDAHKKPIHAWKEFQTKLPTEEQIRQSFESPRAKGIALICGPVSGGLEVIDVDLKYDITGTLYQRLLKKIGAIHKKLYAVKTKSGGYHLYYRCEVQQGNTKLAMRPATPEELKETPGQGVFCLIETRGINGYVVAPPTPGYERLGEFKIPIISIDEREHILSTCRTFNEVFQEVRGKTITLADTTTYQLTPWQDYNEKADIIQLLEAEGWTYVNQSGPRINLRRPGNTTAKTSANYHTDLRLFKVFTTSSIFETDKGYTPFAVYTILKHNGDFSAAAKQLIKDGYGTPLPSVERKVTAVVHQAIKDKKSEKEIKALVGSVAQTDDNKKINDVIKAAKSNIGKIDGEFWEVITTAKDKKINIVRHKFVAFLESHGFFLYYYDDKSTGYRIVRVEGTIVYEISYKEIKDFVHNYIINKDDERFDNISKEELLEVVMKGSDIYFGKGLIEFLPKANLEFIRDTEKCAYFFFKNGVVVCDGEQYNLIKYNELNIEKRNKDAKTVIWRSQVIDHEIQINEEDYDSIFLQFMKHVSRYSEENADNFDFLSTLVGYLLHSYKDQSKSFAVILAEETEDETKGGGTGKGILVKAISKLAKVDYVDGKNFKIDKSFAFQRVNLDTKIIAIEDVRKNVDFEGFYPIITEGITIEKKNKDEIFIPYQDSPKIIFTTNYTVPSHGNHSKRRQRVFEFSDFFNLSNTPHMVFNHILFEDWQPAEWNRFYNTLFDCVSLYLQHGVTDYENSETLKRKHIKLNFGQEFLEFMDDLMKLKAPVSRQGGQLYLDFLNENDMERKDFSQKRFKNGIIQYCEKFNYKFAERRDTIEVTDNQSKKVKIYAISPILDTV